MVKLIEEIDIGLESHASLPEVLSLGVLEFYQQIDAIARVQLFGVYTEPDSYVLYNIFAEQFGNRNSVPLREIENALRDFAKTKNWSNHYVTTLLKDYHALKRILPYKDSNNQSEQPHIEVVARDGVMFEPKIRKNKSGIVRMW